MIFFTAVRGLERKSGIDASRQFAAEGFGEAAQQPQSIFQMVRQQV